MSKTTRTARQPSKTLGTIPRTTVIATAQIALMTASVATIANVIVATTTQAVLALVTVMTALWAFAMKTFPTLIFVAEATPLMLAMTY